MLCNTAVMYGGLINVIGGGVTAAALLEFPSPLPLTFAFRAVLEPRRLKDMHVLLIDVSDTRDGFRSSVELTYTRAEGTAQPTSEEALSTPVSLETILIPHPGTYLVAASLDQWAFGTFPLQIERAHAHD
jgi:hypothetical protein